MSDPTQPAVITCALTGVLTDPAQHPVPVTPSQMADEAERAYNAGATVVTPVSTAAGDLRPVVGVVVEAWRVRYEIKPVAIKAAASGAGGAANFIS